MPRFALLASFAAASLALGGAATAQTAAWQSTTQPGGYKVARVAGTGIANGMALTCERGVPVLAVNLARPAPTNPVTLNLDIDEASHPVTLMRNGRTNVWVAAMRNQTPIDALVNGSRVKVSARGQAIGAIPMSGAREAIMGALAGCYSPAPAPVATPPASITPGFNGVAEGVGCPPIGPVARWGSANVVDYNNSDIVFCGDFTGDGADDAFAVIRFAMGANNFGQDAVLFQNVGGQLRFLRRVPEFYGTPGAAKFQTGKVTLDMTIMRPEDARCCPSGKELRQVDTTTGRHSALIAAKPNVPAGKKTGPLSALPIALGPYVAVGEQCRAPSRVTWFEPNGYWDIGADERFFMEIAKVSREGAEYVLEFPVDPNAPPPDPDEPEMNGVMVRPAGSGWIVMTIQDYVSLKLCKPEEIPTHFRP